MIMNFLKRLFGRDSCNVLVVDVKKTGNIDCPYSHSLMNINELSDKERKLAIEAYQYEECGK